MTDDDNDEPCNPYMTNPPCWGCPELMNGCERVWKKNGKGGYDIRSPFEFYKADPEFARKCGIDYSGTCAVCARASDCKLLKALNKVMALNKKAQYYAVITLKECDQFVEK